MWQKMFNRSLDAGSDGSKGYVRDGTGTNDTASPNRRDPQLALGNDPPASSAAPNKLAR
jgi:hypothetical protein